MIKRVGLIITLMASFVVLSWFFMNEDMEESDDLNQNDPPALEKGARSESSETLINEIFTLAKEGKVSQTPFVAGETNINEVKDEWGAPKDKTEEEKGIYEAFPKYNAAVGYKEELIVDVRSYQPALQNIHMDDIKKLKGDADDIRFYKDDDDDKIILTYTINAEYQLKWVLSAKDEKDPVVDHVSVYAYWTEQNRNKRMAAKKLEEMSLEEKIGQMIIAGLPGTSLDTNTKTLINDDKIGGVIFYENNLDTPEQSIQLINDLKAENWKNALPLFISADEEGGKVTRMPGDLTNLPNNDEIGLLNDDAFSFEIGTVLGKELGAFGMNLNYAPVLDINSNPRNTVIGNRSFGNNPELVSEMGKQMMKGIQSERIIPVIKHFPGHGETSVDSHFELPKVNKKLEELSELELIPFKNAINNDADVVMVAHILLPALDSVYPSSMSKEVITNLLRDELNFSGVVITDDMTMKAITDNYDIGNAALESVKAGSDIILVAHDYYKVVFTIEAIKSAVAKGEVSEERIDESVNRIIRLKLKYKLNDEKVPDVNIDELNEEIQDVLEEDKEDKEED